MAYPTPGTRVTTPFATSVTSMKVNLPASIASGDLLIAVAHVRNAGTFTKPSGWQDLGNQAGGSSVGKITAFYKIADGTEGSTATWTASTGTTAEWHVIKITSWHGTTPPEAAFSFGDYTTQPDPPNIAPSWGSEENLFLEFAGNSATAALTTGASANYINYYQNTASSGGAQVNLASANRELTASSENPGTFANAGNIRYWAAITIAIRPAGESGPVEKNIAETGQGEESISITNNRYWVGGSGNWSDNTNHWSDVSGGTPGASLPTATDNVFIDANSGFGSGGTITLDVYPIYCNNFTSNSGHSYTIAYDEEAESLLTIYGSTVLESGITFSDSGIMCYPQGEETLTSNGAILPFFIMEDIGKISIQDNLVVAGRFYQDNGTFDANDHNVTASNFYFYADTGCTPTVIMGSGTWEATGSGWYIEEVAEVVTFTPETSTIKLSGGGSMDYDYDDFVEKTYNNLWITVGSSTTLFYSSNTFNNLKIDAGATVVFGNGTTQTISSLTAVGTLGNEIVLKSSNSTTQFTLSKSSGVVECDYLDISNSNVTGGANWYAGSNSVNGGNNTGWIWGDVFQIEVSDIGEAVDILNILNQLSISDIGSVNELVNILGLIGKTDNATATESINILNSLNVSETATGSDVIDLLLLLKELTLSEIGLGSEELSIIGSSSIELTENASGQDILYILNYISAHEIGSGIEDLDILEELNISDSAIGNEFLETLSENGVFDNASAIDIIAKYIFKIYTKRNNPYGVKSNPYTKKTNPFSIKN